MINATTSAPLFKQKTIVWDTNFNAKMACAAFLHIDFAPSTVPSRYQVDNTVITIKTADGSHEPVKVQLHDIFCLPLSKTCMDTFTLSSHGLTAQEFAKWLMDERHPGKVNWETLMAVYYYKKIETT